MSDLPPALRHALIICAVALKRLGIHVKFMNSIDPADWVAAIDADTKALYVETMSNPKLVFNPIKELSQVRARILFSDLPLNLPGCTRGKNSAYS